MTHNIVPVSHKKTELYDPLTQDVAPSATLVYSGGPLLANAEVFTVFFGDFWTQELMQDINTFFGDILVSDVVDNLAEYSTPDYTVGHGKYIGTHHVNSPVTNISVSDHDIRQWLHYLVTSARVPLPDENTLFFLYFPSGITVMQGDAQSCDTYCGYHDVAPGHLYYAVMPYPDCDGCIGPYDALTTLKATSTHELCEAITDPVPGTGWYDQDKGEIGDICAWQFRISGTHTVQKEWSNQQRMCL